MSEVPAVRFVDFEQAYTPYAPPPPKLGPTQSPIERWNVLEFEPGRRLAGFFEWHQYIGKYKCMDGTTGMCGSQGGPGNWTWVFGYWSVGERAASAIEVALARKEGRSL